VFSARGGKDLDLKTVVIVAHDEETSRLLWNILRVCQAWSPLMVVDGPTLLKSLNVVTPDLVILENATDYSDSLTTYRLLRAHPLGRDVPVLFVTDGLGKGEAAQLMGTHTILDKPVDQGALIQNVASMLGGSESKASQACIG
jgi:CheY-like chemotaxis protein